MTENIIEMNNQYLSNEFGKYFNFQNYYTGHTTHSG